MLQDNNTHKCLTRKNKYSDFLLLFFFVCVEMKNYLTLRKYKFFTGRVFQKF